eukprot:gene28771-31953_t
MSESDNLLRVLISTDNHLGVWEKDEIRKDDSFVSFEEVLTKASELKVDFVLLGGDLFHDNRPSRATVVRTIQIIKKYSFNDTAVSFQILSDQSSNFVSGIANYLDPNLNVGLPIFTIHGNHDDPSGADSLSAVDILSSCGLINYFGKHVISGSSIGRINLSPILMQKGDTRLALYGLGAVRDERLGRLFQTPGMVSWLRPEDTPDASSDDWLNIMVLHQNRVAHGGAQSKAYIQESFLPRFLDLVVWGHEHECRADPEEIQNPMAKVDGSGRAGAIVVQPGSSVATSLSQGESVRKHCVLLEVMGSQFRTIKYPLETVRPFVYRNLALKDGGSSVKPEDQNSVTHFLESKVNDMIQQANREYPPLPDVSPRLPLIRLKVDYSGFSTINAQRFGQSFVNKVANPQDILTWAKAQGQRRVKPEGAPEDEDMDILRPEALDQARIEDLVAQNLQQDLEVLQEEDLAIALHDYVEKDDKLALAEVLKRTLHETQMSAMRDPRGTLMGDGDDEITKLVGSCVEQWKAEKASRPRTVADRELQSIGTPSAAGPDSLHPAGGDGIEDEDANLNGRATTFPLKAAPSTAKRGAAVKVGSTAKPPASRSARGGATGGRQSQLFEAFQRGAANQATQNTTGRGMGNTGQMPPPSPATAPVASSRSRLTPLGKKPSYAAADDDDLIIDDDEEEEPVVSRSARGAGGSSSRSGAAKRQQMVISDDDVSPVLEETMLIVLGVSSSARASGRSSSRSGASKRQQLVIFHDDVDDDDDDEVLKGGADSDEIDSDSDAPTRGRKRPAASKQKQPLKPSKVNDNSSARRRTSPAPTPGRQGTPGTTLQNGNNDNEMTIDSSDEENAGTKNQAPATAATPSATPSTTTAGGRKLPASMMSSLPAKSKKNWGTAKR